MELVELNFDRLPQGRGSRAAGQELFLTILLHAPPSMAARWRIACRNLTPPVSWPAVLA